MRKKSRSGKLTIPGIKGGIYNLSKQIYVFKKHYRTKHFRFRKGTKVRLISGVDGNANPGYHFVPEYITICRANAVTAQFIGVPRKVLGLYREE